MYPKVADTYDQPPASTDCITFGHRAFSVAGPTVWNSLPTEFRHLSVSLDIFRRLLRRYYSRDINASSATEMYA